MGLESALVVVDAVVQALEANLAASQCGLVVFADKVGLDSAGKLVDRKENNMAQDCTFVVVGVGGREGIVGE